MKIKNYISILILSELCFCFFCSCKLVNRNYSQTIALRGHQIELFKNGDKRNGSNANCDNYKIIKFNKNLDSSLIIRLTKKYNIIKNFSKDILILNVNDDEISKIRSLSAYEAESVYPSKLKMFASDSTTILGNRKTKYFLDLFPDAEIDNVIGEIESRKIKILRKVSKEKYNLKRIFIEVNNAEDLNKLKSICGIYFIEKVAEGGVLNSKASNRVKYNSEIINTASRIIELKGEGQILGHIDSGLDTSHCAFKEKVKFIYSLSHSTRDHNHGTKTAGSSIGNESNSDGIGMASNALIVHANYLDRNSIYNITLLEQLDTLSHYGARIHNNSYYDKLRPRYSLFSRDIDNYTYINEQEIVLFAGNRGRPGTAVQSKNAMCVNAIVTNNLDECRSGIKDYTIDGRIKPDLVAPGENILSSKYNSTHCDYEEDCGSSLAVSFISGAALLIREHLIVNENLTRISGNLLKAFLYQCANPIITETVYPASWNSGFGFGQIHLNEVINNENQTSLVQKFHNEGISLLEHRHTHEINVDSSSNGMNITLVWNDPPAEPSESTNRLLQNDLNLELRNLETNDFYLGNNFAFNSKNSVKFNASQIGSLDSLNNVEQIRVADIEPGRYEIRIDRGSFFTSLSQGYAFIVTQMTK